MGIRVGAARALAGLLLGLALLAGVILLARPTAPGTAPPAPGAAADRAGAASATTGRRSWASSTAPRWAAAGAKTSRPWNVRDTGVRSRSSFSISNRPWIRFIRRIAALPSWLSYPSSRIVLRMRSVSS